MDLNLSVVQRELRSGLRDYLADAWPPDRLRAAADADRLDREPWRELAGLGLFGLMRPEEDGGMSLNWADAVILFEELGRVLVPGPLVATFLAAGPLLAAGAVPGAATGEAVVTAIDTRDAHAVLEYPADATHLVVADDAGLFLLPPPPDAAAAARPLDPLTPVAPVDRAQVRPEAGERVGSAADAARWRRAGALLTAALQVGVAQGALDLAVRYAREREQFGRAIGSFQAVKHLLADALARADLARAAVLVAALTLDAPACGDSACGDSACGDPACDDSACGDPACDDSACGDPAEAVASAKVLADDAATVNGRTGIQVHGGMGFTWDVLAHLYLKRAWLHETAYGTASEHALALAETL
jgi:alkylation response protein AidB-like acyl-CoA dehydrogenase